MLITSLRRFELSAAHRLPGPGPEGLPHGHNYSLWVGVLGPVQPESGLIVGHADFSALVTPALDRYDHSNLNVELGDREPSAVAFASALWEGLRPRVRPPAVLASVELLEEDGCGAFALPSGVSAVQTGEFSAAHRTHAPRLTDAENLALYGICNNPAGHGHNYRVELYGQPDLQANHDPWAEFDHRNLSTDIPELRGRNVVTEAIAELVARRVPTAHRVRVWETSTFSVEYQSARNSYRLARRYRFNAVHRLFRPELSEEANRRLYGQCSRPGLHGHTYSVEVSVRGEWDSRTDTAGDVAALDRLAAGILPEVDHTDLDGEAAALAKRLSTCENVAAYLWARFGQHTPTAMAGLRLWETPNHQCLITGGQHES